MAGSKIGGRDRGESYVFGCVMKISSEWLREYIELPGDLARLRDDLTMAGLVVESVTGEADAPVFELEVTSNRPDCLSYLGVAREIAARYGTKLRPGRTARSLRAAKEIIPYSIEIRDPDLCPRYVGLVLDQVKLAPSPPWMQRRLEASGMRAVNNIVDITNYVLLECGHPLHAFDFDGLHEGRIIVARARAGQKMMTLDGVERTLDTEMLLINDGAGPVAIGGVMGGLESEIGATTSRVLLECAYFQPASIRRTSKKLGLSTEASYRFERGADWNGPLAAIARTCYLMRQLAGARIAGSVQDVFPAPMTPVEIEFRLDRAQSLLGVTLTPSFVESTLKSLHFKPARKGKGRWLVQCPTYRADMELEADLIEEIARFYGYQNIPTTLPAARTVGEPSPVESCERGVRRILLGLGYSETMNLSFAGVQDSRRFPPREGEALEIQNPLTEDTQFLRCWLAQGLVQAAQHNFNHGQRSVRLFEIGKIFGRDGARSIVERTSLGMVAAGSLAPANWLGTGADYDFFHLKGAVAALLSGLRCRQVEFEPAPPVNWLDESACAALMVDRRQAGLLGRLHPALEEEFRLKQPVYLAEIDFQCLYPSLFAPCSFEPLPRFPSAERDLSIVISRDIEYRSIHQGIVGLNIPELAGVSLIDVYEGNQIPAGRVSLTFRLTFLDQKGTLTVDRVQGFSDNIRSFLRDQFGAEGR
jgi:phenylalanyl-tRNA synthetase beta chain